MDLPNQTTGAKTGRSRPANGLAEQLIAARSGLTGYGDHLLESLTY